MRLPLSALLVAGALACACASVPRTDQLAPLEREGEVHLQLLPLSADAARLSFQLASVSALRPDGSAVTLELLADAVSARSGTDLIEIAQGRLEPGRYTGFLLAVRRATLATPSGEADLLVPEEPVRVETPFTVTARQATLVSLELRPSKSTQTGFSFEPSFVAPSRPKPVPQLLGISTNTDLHNLTLFDKRTHQVSAIWPTGAGPWGIALDVVANRAYVALSARDELQVFDVAAGTELSRHRLTAGDVPRELVLTRDRRFLLCVNSGSSSLAIIDPGSMFEVARVQVAEAPTSVVLDRAGTRAFVSGARNTVTVVDLVTRMVVGNLRTEDRPLRVQLDRAGARLFVAQEASAYLTVYSVPSLVEEKRAYVGLGTTFIKVDPNTDLLYVANRDSKRVDIYDTTSMLAIDAIPVDGAVGWLSISDAENALFILQPELRRVSVVDLTSRQRVAEFPVGRGARVLSLAGERE